MLDKNFDFESFEKNFSFEIEASLRNSKAEPFMVLLPPPNVTGSLHMGHALCYTLQDVVARYKRLKGYDVLFQPGIDHAGIVTQLLVEKLLHEKGIEKKSLSRDTLLKEIWFWKENSGGNILNQMKTLGISCDFSRQRFTLDENSKKAITKVFIKLFEDGLIYRGERMVNWDPLIGSAISDLEVSEREVDGRLCYIKYNIVDSSECITVATTRPETLFGDVAVAVNPKDEKYAHWIGKSVIIPFTNRKIPVIADDYADPTKGSGAVKITPAHDFNDYIVGTKHKLPIIEIMDANGELNENVPELFQKTNRFDARDKIIGLLEKNGLLEKVDIIKQTIPFGDRSGVPLEPRITSQWFVDAEKLASAAIQAVKSGKIKFIPKHWENLYFEWLDNIKPWCISRQIWWGHRIPAWYGPDGQVFVAENADIAMQKAIKFYGKNVIKLTQDEDVLDTWFSSGMWPLITLGWPNDTEELHRFYSKMIVVTGFDIIFFWIARMVMMCTYATKEIPFPEVYIHSLVRDEKGQKMSKSKGNVIDPISLCKKYGADALRYTLTSLASPGRDIRMSDKSIEIGRNFLTKLWNVVRFAQINGCVHNKDFQCNKISNPICLWIIYQTKKMVENVEASIENYRFDEVVGCIYRCIKDYFCDWYMEFIKPILQKSAITDKEIEGYSLSQTLLKKDIRDTTAWAIQQFMRVLYPITPFIAKKLSGEMGVLEMSWPDLKKMEIDYKNAIEEIEFLKEIISSVRSMKQCINIAPKENLKARIETSDSNFEAFIANYSDILHEMAGISIGSVTGQTVPIVLGKTIIHIEFSGKINVAEEKERLRREILKLEKVKVEATARLSNEDFISKAAEEVVSDHKNRVNFVESKIQQINYIIQNLEVV
ncbi:MAG: valine--tRNA ligase [Holosporaceae bacterium]|jgi:valyl-tRNA synthetase|nr:valine--tRNA ligase [Holosporaceae bacterium]